jgi:ribosomal protein S13
MTDESPGASQLSLSRGSTDPSEYESFEAKARFAVAKYYGMGSDGRWSPEEIADALNVTPRHVYNYLNDSEIGRETREVHATTKAEWRLDTSLYLRREVERLEEIEEELLQRSTTVSTEFEEKTVKGTPTGDESIAITDDKDRSLTIPVPSKYEEVTDYGRDLEQVQREKRQYIDQICTLLGLYQHDVPANTLSEGSDDRPPVEYRGVGNDSDEDSTETSV